MRRFLVAAAIAVVPVLPLPALPPPLPPPCVPVPVPPPLPPCVTPKPVPGDNPPVMVSLSQTLRTKQNVKLRWRARDDKGVWGFRFYVDRRFVSRAGQKAYRVAFHLRCGAHWYRVEVVDTAGQGDVASVRVVREC